MTKEELLRAKALAPVPITKYLDGYDTCDLVDGEVKYRLEEDDEVKTRLAEAGPEGRAAVEEKVREEVNADPVVFEQAFDDLCEDLTEEIRRLTHSQTAPGHIDVPMYFRLEMNNFGWRELNGHKYVRVTSGRELIAAILPNCECTYRFFKVKHGGKLVMQNSHHDSPVGREFYIILPISERTYNSNKDD